MANPTLNDIKLHMIKVREASVRTGDWICCLNCENWTEVNQITDEQRVYNWCGLYSAHPPDEVVVVGCAEHTPAIPF